MGLKEFLIDHLKGLGYIALGLIILFFDVEIFIYSSPVVGNFIPMFGGPAPGISPIVGIIVSIAFFVLLLLIGLVAFYFMRKGTSYIRSYW